MSAIISDIRLNDPDDGAAIAGITGITLLPHDPIIARVTSEGKLLGGVIYTEFSGEGGSIEIHCAGLTPRWGSRTILWAMFAYPFLQLRVKKLFAEVLASNTHALSVVVNLGFKHEHTIKDAVPDGDIELLAMYRSDCRFLGITPRGFSRGST